tara:strand:- start:11663 stop:12082 length:420 start_codon:yes stop_codon:yes gene_type:complete
MKLKSNARIGWRYHDDLWEDISPRAQDIIKPIIAIGINTPKMVKERLMEEMPELFDQRFNALCARMGRTTKSPFWQYKEDFDLVCSRASRFNYASRKVIHDLQKAIDDSVYRYNQWKQNGTVTLDYYDLSAEITTVAHQ